MSKLWTHMIDHLSGDLDILKDPDDHKATMKASLYVEEALLPKDVAITYHLKNIVKADDAV